MMKNIPALFTYMVYFSIFSVSSRNNEEYFLIGFGKIFKENSEH